MKFEAKYYQKFCIQKIIDQPELGLLLDMGMGKTAITLSAVEELMYDCFSIRKVLVIAPLEPAKETWPAEIEKWDHTRHMDFSMVIGSKEGRIAALRREADIYIINRENVQWLVTYYKKAWPFDMVVIDELSSFKSSKAQRFRALKKVRPYIKRIVGLTGTPSPNGLLDLWPEMYLLDGGKALGKTLTGYRDQYFLPDKRNQQMIFSWKPRQNAEEEIYKKLEGLCISMKTADYLQLPERLDVRHEIELSEEALAIYRKLEKDMLLPYEDGDIDAGSAAILTNKLLQVAGGAAYNENGDVKMLHDEKLKALDTLIEEANGQPVLLFYAYKHECDRIKERYPEAVDVKEKSAVKEWNAGHIPILLAHPASAGHGLNLQFGGHIVIWYGLPCSLELYQQANKRVHRMGQKQTVLIHHLLMKDTADTWVLDQVLTPKAERQNALLEALLARIKEVKA
ncbi:MAG: DEAD/DEAH box helicase [Ruminococcus flavefaciens]|nr:DEAD/DEAH box helicase [Ruminococcus flavefaciens]